MTKANIVYDEKKELYTLTKMEKQRAVEMGGYSQNCRKAL